MLLLALSAAVQSCSMQIFSYKKFKLEYSLTTEQINFFNEFGFIHFENFYREEKVNEILQSTEQVQQQWIENNVNQVNGIPIKFGVNEKGEKIVQRFSFTNKYSQPVQHFLDDSRLTALKSLISDHSDSRIATDEKDGVVVNHYVNVPDSSYKHLGWHTDSARDIFYGGKINPMLNIGLYLDDSNENNGGLRILPGTHRQNIFSLLFKKTYFFNTNDDENEVLVRAKKGDLVIHDGRIWHRVAQSPHYGEKSRRRVLYVPLIAGKYEPKNEKSKTPFYLKFQKLVG
jgi:phytanoyl-CoA hydroxylase